MKKLLFTLFITSFFSILFIFQQVVRVITGALSHVPAFRRFSVKYGI